MLSETDAYNLIEDVLRRSNADECEVTVQGGVGTEARYEVSRVSVRRTHKLSLNIRAAYYVAGTMRQAFVTTDNLTVQSIDDAFLAARALAEQSHSETEWPGMVHPYDVEMTEVETVAPIDSTTRNTGPSFHADAISDVVMQCERTGLHATAAFGTSTGELYPDGSIGTFALGNSNGWLRHHLTTRAWYDARVETEDGGIGTSYGFGRRRADIDPLTLGRAAFNAAIAPLDPATIDTSASLVLFEPLAVQTLLDVVLPHFSATAVAARVTPLRTQVGQQIAALGVSLTANPASRELAMVPFDAEGVPSASLRLIDEGTHRDVAIGRSLAEARGTQPNGYGLQASRGGTEAPRGIVWGGGDGTAQDLIARQQLDVIRIPRVHRPVIIDPFTALVELQSSDGAFRCSPQGGQVGLPDVRIRVSIWSLLQQVTDVGTSTRTDRMFLPPIVVYGLAVSTL